MPILPDGIVTKTSMDHHPFITPSNYQMATVTSTEKILVRWNHVSDHALTILGIAPPELYINPLVLHHFMYFRQLLM
jgi:hypothetical protein